MNVSAHLSIGMDIGGTKTAAIVIDDNGTIGSTVTVPTTQGNEGVLQTAEKVIQMLADETGCDASSFASVGIGVPGQVDRDLGEVRYAHNLGIESLALAPLLSKRTGLQVSLDNDVTAAAIGATHLMQLSGPVAYVNLGTGLSAGIVLDGHPWRGARGLAGEVGHLAVDSRMRPCPCGQRGCLETVASGSALKTYWPAGGEHPGWVLADAAAAGDPDAAKALELLVQGAAGAIRALGVTIAPEHVVIGGGLRKIGAPRIEGIREALTSWEADSE
ncbi:MAG: ROK family protein, partial [Actinomycetales bacterium]|nr:ROK family protein [Actinomycetales bacterium]